jgi:hypothetical protein
MPLQPSRRKRPLPHATEGKGGGNPGPGRGRDQRANHHACKQTATKPSLPSHQTQPPQTHNSNTYPHTHIHATQTSTQPPPPGRPASPHQVVPDDVCFLQEEPHLVCVLVQLVELGALEPCTVAREGEGGVACMREARQVCCALLCPALAPAEPGPAAMAAARCAQSAGVAQKCSAGLWERPAWQPCQAPC